MMHIEIEEHGGVSVRVGRLALLYAQRELWVCWIGWGPIGWVRMGSA